MSDDAEHNRRALAEVRTLSADVFFGCVFDALASIKTGSAETGAPGQPVDTGNLRNSWQVEFDDPEFPTEATIGTPVEYAQAVEDAVGPHGHVLYGKSGVGGSHSAKLTVATFQRIVDRNVERVDKLRQGGA